MSERSKSDQQPEDLAVVNRNLDTFWADQAGDSDIQLTKDHQYAIVSVFFHMRLDPLRSAPGEPARNLRVKEFSAWLPFSKAEMETAMDGAVRRIQRAHHTNNGDQNRATQETYKSFVRYLQDAYTQLGIIRKCLSDTENGVETFDAVKMRQLIREDEKFRSLLATYLLQKENLDHYGAPQQKNRKEFFLGAVSAVANSTENLNDDLLHTFYKHVAHHAHQRKDYWKKELNEVKKLDFVQKVIADPSFIPPSLLRRRSIEQDQVSEAEQETAPQEVGKLVINQVYEEGMPKDILELNLQKYADKSSKIDTQVHQGTPQHVAELRVLGAPAIRDSQGRIIGVEANEERGGYLPPGSSKPRRNNWPESGPSDKRVEKDHY